VRYRDTLFQTRAPIALPVEDRLENRVGIAVAAVIGHVLDEFLDDLLLVGAFKVELDMFGSDIIG